MGRRWDQETHGKKRWYLMLNPKKQQQWGRCVARFENLFVARNITSDNRKKSVLLHHGSEEIFDIYIILQSDISGTFEDTKRCLTEHCAPKHNSEYEIYMSRQNSSEAVNDSYYTRLLSLSKNYDFFYAEKKRDKITQITKMYF